VLAPKEQVKDVMTKPHVPGAICTKGSEMGNRNRKYMHNKKERKTIKRRRAVYFIRVMSEADFAEGSPEFGGIILAFKASECVKKKNRNKKKQC
jgi:hypothetical protein